MRSTAPTGVQAVLDDFEMSALPVIAGAKEVDDAEKSPECTVAFADALKRAISAFASDRRGSGEAAGDSPAALVAATPELFARSAGADTAAIATMLLDFLRQDRGAEIILLTPTTIQVREYRFLPEYGESIETNWVFRIRLPNTLNLLIWVIVDRAGRQAPYAYTFD